MNEHLVLRLLEDDSAQWLLVGQDGRPRGEARHGSLSEVPATAGYATVLVPTAQVLVSTVSVPTQSRARALTAAPYALEEQVVGDVEALHFALGPFLAGRGAFAVAVAARERMDHWLALLRNAGLQPGVLAPDLLAVPAQAEGWGVWLEPDRALVRMGESGGFAAEPDTLPTLLELAVSQADAPPARLTVYRSEGADTVLPTLEGVQVHEHREPAGLLGRYPAQRAQIDALNLLQGAYSRREQISQLWRPWRATAALLAALGVVALIQAGVEYHQLSQRHQALTQRIEQIYRKSFPEARRVVNPQAQMKHRLEVLRQSQGREAGFLGLLARAGDALHQTTGVRLTGASYREGHLDLDLTAHDLQVLDRLKQRLTGEGGLKVDIQSATAGSDKRVQGRLRIAAAGST